MFVPNKNDNIGSFKSSENTRKEGVKDRPIMEGEVSHYFPQMFMLITKDMIFLSFRLYQVSYICFELKQFWLGIQLSSSGSDLGSHTRPNY